MNKKLTKILKSSREASGLTQKQVAEAIKKSERTYQYYEEGRSYPKHATIVRLGHILNFNPKDIFNEEQGDLVEDAAGVIVANQLKILAHQKVILGLLAEVRGNRITLVPGAVTDELKAMVLDEEKLLREELGLKS